MKLWVLTIFCDDDYTTFAFDERAKAQAYLGAWARKRWGEELPDEGFDDIDDISTINAWFGEDIDFSSYSIRETTLNQE